MFVFNRIMTMIDATLRCTIFLLPLSKKRNRVRSLSSFQYRYYQRLVVVLVLVAVVVLAEKAIEILSSFACSHLLFVNSRQWPPPKRLLLPPAFEVHPFVSPFSSMAWSEMIKPVLRTDFQPILRLDLPVVQVLRFRLLRSPL